MPNGSKQWLLDYFKPFTEKRISLSLWAYPEVSILEARKKRIASRELLASHTLKSVAED